MARKYNNPVYMAVLAMVKELSLFLEDFINVHEKSIAKDIASDLSQFKKWLDFYGNDDNFNQLRKESHKVWGFLILYNHNCLICRLEKRISQFDDNALNQFCNESESLKVLVEKLKESKGEMRLRSGSFEPLQFYNVLFSQAKTNERFKESATEETKSFPFKGEVLANVLGSLQEDPSLSKYFFVRIFKHKNSWVALNNRSHFVRLSESSGGANLPLYYIPSKPTQEELNRLDENPPSWCVSRGSNEYKNAQAMAALKSPKTGGAFAVCATALGSSGVGDGGKNNEHQSYELGMAVKVGGSPTLFYKENVAEKVVHKAIGRDI